MPLRSEIHAQFLLFWYQLSRALCPSNVVPPLHHQGNFPWSSRHFAVPELTIALHKSIERKLHCWSHNDPKNKQESKMAARNPASADVKGLYVFKCNWIYDDSLVLLSYWEAFPSGSVIILREGAVKCRKLISHIDTFNLLNGMKSIEKACISINCPYIHFSHLFSLTE